VKRFVLLFALLSACTANTEEAPALDESEESELQGRGSATMTFAADYSESITGSPAVGGRLKINYAASRLSQCRANLNNGKPAWTITGFLSVNRAPAKTFYVAGHNATGRTTPEEVTLEQAGDAQLWFQVTNIFGCSAYDSNLSKNYTLKIAEGSSARLVFDADPSRAPALEGRLVAGTRVAIEYPATRLPSCRMNLNGGAPGWTITGFASVNGGQPKSFYVAGHSSDPSAAGKTPFVDVTSAGRLAIWFQVTNASGCSAWDSNLGRNYTFDVAR
jgi:hypothetical protein